MFKVTILKSHEMNAHACKSDSAGRALRRAHANYDNATTTRDDASYIETNLMYANYATYIHLPGTVRVSFTHGSGIGSGAVFKVLVLAKPRILLANQECLNLARYMHTSFI